MKIHKTAISILKVMLAILFVNFFTHRQRFTTFSTVVRDIKNSGRKDGN